MTDPTSNPEGVTPERLAALIDGRLDERERAEVLRELAADPELRAIYADAVAVARELEDGTGAAGAVLPFRRPPRPRWWRNGTILAAAGLAAVALVPVIRWRTDTGPAQLVASISTEGSIALPPAVWPVVRSTDTPMTAHGRAVRLGARLADLELAIVAHDTGMRAVAASVAELLVAGPPVTGAPVALYREIASGAPPAALDARREAWLTVSELAGEEAARLGAWLEVARVAAARRDMRFFRTRETRRVLGGGAAARDEEERAAIAWVRGAVGEDGAPQWAALEPALEEALRLAGR